MTDKAITLFKNTLQNESVQERFRTILNEKSPAFLASLLSLVTQEDSLQKCEPSSILTSAAKAAILDLPIERSLGFAWIVPFKNKAEFIMGYKGYIQLALRTSFYDAINATMVYQGEEIVENRLTGEIKLNGQRINDEVIGYAAYFRLKNGFEKFIYMDVDEVNAHAKKYSKSYGHKNSAWTTNFDDMGKKTVIRLLLSRYGLLSIEMQDADTKDLPFIDAGDNGRLTQTPDDLVVPDFEDVVDAEIVETDDDETEINGEELIFQAIVDAGLSENVHAAKNALQNYCQTGYDTTEKALAWFRPYRGWRDMDKTPQEAGKLANEGKMPK